MRQCSKCGVEQPLENFYRAAGGRDGRRGECIACFKAYREARYPEVREQAIARAKAWQAANRERHLANQRERRSRPEFKAKARADHLRRKFGITLDTYDEMLAEQGGVCAICERPRRDDISLHVDHEHETGRVRGLLCFRCNNALGDFEDDAVLLLRAADYVVFDPEARELATQRVAALVAERTR
jgi:hypothetical protein